MDYNAAYVHMDEARNDWRPYLTTKIAPLVADLSPSASISEVVATVNDQMWDVLGHDSSTPIVFKSGQTPLIYDPFSTITYGYASCTGTSILFADALRSVGVATRVAGTPKWHNNAAEGNHNWIEVLYSKNKDSNFEWGIIEGATAATGEVQMEIFFSLFFLLTLPSFLPSLKTLEDPCDKWFCNPEHFGRGNASSPVYATRFDKFKADTYYRMSWNILNTDVPGVDRSDFYNGVCSRCASSPSKGTLSNAEKASLARGRLHE